MTFPTFQRIPAPTAPVPNEKVRMVLDTDTYNEIDDQFALVYALLCPEKKLNVEAVYAAPFMTGPPGPATGWRRAMKKSCALLERLHMDAERFVYRGSTDYLSRGKPPQRSAAVDDLIRQAVAAPDDDPLYVVAIGAITNVAAALLCSKTDLVARSWWYGWVGTRTTSRPR